MNWSRQLHSSRWFASGAVGRTRMGECGEQPSGAWPMRRRAGCRGARPPPGRQRVAQQVFAPGHGRAGRSGRGRSARPASRPANSLPAGKIPARNNTGVRCSKGSTRCVPALPPGSVPGACRGQRHIPASTRHPRRARRRRRIRHSEIHCAGAGSRYFSRFGRAWNGRARTADARRRTEGAGSWRAPGDVARDRDAEMLGDRSECRGDEVTGSRSGNCDSARMAGRRRRIPGRGHPRRRRCRAYRGIRVPTSALLDMPFELRISVLYRSLRGRVGRRDRCDFGPDRGMCCRAIRAAPGYSIRSYLLNEPVGDGSSAAKHFGMLEIRDSETRNEFSRRPVGPARRRVGILVVCGRGARS